MEVETAISSLDKVVIIQEMQRVPSMYHHFRAIIIVIQNHVHGIKTLQTQYRIYPH